MLFLPTNFLCSGHEESEEFFVGPHILSPVKPAPEHEQQQLHSGKETTTVSLGSRQLCLRHPEPGLGGIACGHLLCSEEEEGV